jgi:dephospho-CoA kinase
VLTVAVTGGIGSGKSTVATILAGLGAVVVDSDQLAREVVAPGTAGLAAVTEQFGPGVLAPDGSLDRAAMAGIVFADPRSRARLEAIVHPLVRAEFRQAREAAGLAAIVVNDIPLVRTLADAAAFHLVVGVGAAEEVRIARLAARGMPESDAGARIASQIGDDIRRELADAWIDNSGDEAALRAAVRGLWESRLVPFQENLLAGRRASRARVELVAARPDWPALGRLLCARVSAAAGGLECEHIGSTAVPGLDAKDVIDLQLAVPDLAAADALAPALGAAGFPLVPGIERDNPHPAATGLQDEPGSGLPRGDEHSGWLKRLHGNADPGRSVNLHLRVRVAPNWRWALLVRDWLRADAGARAEYLAVKRGLAARFAADPTTAGYAEAKEPWFAAAAPRAEAWAASTGWRAPD